MVKNNYRFEKYVKFDFFYDFSLAIRNKIFRLMNSILKLLYSFFLVEQNLIVIFEKIERLKNYYSLKKRCKFTS